ncbi:RELT-like protein 2 [Xyrichtys novacula]|uniref:RELT-like protein 2 n=1 Tax=Xyrichtys novacula TaxID=13765 RepID=A0AAV1F9Y5_XYRNO|nr:RELT-like protein 2 [Xyrichtys novacula]
MSDLEASGQGENPPPYIIFVVVFLFFITGLLGFLICHLLKKKGYRCRTGDMDDDEEEEEKLGGHADDEDEEHQDTVEQILKCIIENEANMEAFNEMIGNHNVCVRHDPRLRKESIGGVPPHLHTVHSGTDHNSCHLCAQVKSKKGRRHSRTPRFKQKPGEQTVFSVGRFRVTHTDKKPHGGPNPLISSGDQLDQSHDSDERKEGGYNLRSMFKDVRPPSESPNGVAPSAGKRRRSLTIFGLRRSSDPVTVKATEGTGRETGGVRFAIRQQPVVQEELSQGGSPKVSSEQVTEPKPAPSKNQTPASTKHEAKISEVSPSSLPETGMIKPSTEVKTATPPSSLPVYSPSLASKTEDKPRDVEVKVFKLDEGFDPGPLQTSTPIAPMYGSLIPANQPECYPNTDYPVTQTPPDQSSSQDLEPGVGANLALISLGSSPPSSYPLRTPSSVSSLKTPTSPLTITPSPKLGSRNTPSEATKTVFSPVLTPSPKLPSGRIPPSFGVSSSPSQVRTPSPALRPGTMPVSPQTPSSPADQKLELTPGPTKREIDSSSSPVGENEQEGARTQRTEEKTEIKRAGILKKPKPEAGGEFSKESAPFSPSGQLSEGRPAGLFLSPSSPLTPSSPKIESITIVKASPDSKREFSVVTMVETDESSSSAQGQAGQTSEMKAGSEEISPAVAQEREGFVSGVKGPDEQSEETSGSEIRQSAAQERDDMVEMEDIGDCKVTQDAEEEEGTEDKTLKMESKQD